jgi:hypothetical protein
MRGVQIAMLAITTGVGCVGITEHCTLIGCIGTLTIAFDAPPTVAYHIDAVSVTDGLRTFDCP